MLNFPSQNHFFVKLIQLSMTKRNSKFNILHIIVYRFKNFQIHQFIYSYYTPSELYNNTRSMPKFFYDFFLVWM